MRAFFATEYTDVYALARRIRPALAPASPWWAALAAILGSAPRVATQLDLARRFGMPGGELLGPFGPILAGALVLVATPVCRRTLRALR